MTVEGKKLLLITAENIENGVAEFNSIYGSGILYNIMLSTDYGYKPFLDEKGFCQFLFNSEKGWEIDACTIWFIAAEELDIEEDILRQFVKWCNQQSDETTIAYKLKEMNRNYDFLSLVTF